MSKNKFGRFAKKAALALALIFSLGLLVAGNTFAASTDALCKNVGKKGGDRTVDCGPVGNKGEHVYAKNMSWCAQAASWAANPDACSEGRDVNTIVKTIINVIIYIVGLLAVVMIIIGGITYTTSAGDPGKTKKAKDTILYGIIGLVIAVLAFAIVNFVMNSILSGQGA